MRVLYFSRSHTAHDKRFLTALAQSHHDVWFLPLEHSSASWQVPDLPERVDLAEWSPPHIRPDAPATLLEAMPAFQQLLAHVKPDLVHAGPTQLCGFLAALSGFRPFMLMSWGSDILLDADKSDLSRWITRFTLSHSDLLLCDCQAVHDKAIDIHPPYKSKPVVQLPWGTDLRSFTPVDGPSQLRAQLGWDDAFVVLSTRSWEPLYGIDVLLRAFSSALAENPRLRLLLLGTGSLEPALTDFIAEQKLQDSVYRPGTLPHEELPAYFQAADLYLSCSLSDGTSVSLLEALATGLPAVVTDLPANREWLVEGENGWLADRGVARAFAQALLAAASQDVRDRRAMSGRNRLLAEERADWHLNVGKLLETYDVIEERIGVGAFRDA